MEVIMDLESAKVRGPVCEIMQQLGFHVGVSAHG